MEFLHQEYLPDAMGTLAVAFITTGIAVAIFLTERGPAFEFDKAVIVQNVVRVRRFLLCILALVVPIFFIEAAGPVLKGVLFSIHIGGALATLPLLRNAYRWIIELETHDNRALSAYRNACRIKYFKGLGPGPHKRAAWAFLFQIEDRTAAEELEFAEEFVKTVDALLNRGMLREAQQHLLQLEECVDNVTLEDAEVMERYLLGLLRWKLAIGHAGAGAGEAQDRERRQTQNIIKRILHHIFKRALDRYMAYDLLALVSAFLRGEHGGAAPPKYVREVLMLILPNLLDRIAESPAGPDYWPTEIPADWKITRDALADPYNTQAAMGLVCVNIWLDLKIEEMRKHERTTDPGLDKVIVFMFPKSDPTVLTTLLAFALTDWGEETPGERARRFLDGFIRFGFHCHPDFKQVSVREAHGIVRHKFPEDFEPEMVAASIEALEAMGPEANGERERNRRLLLKFFEDLRDATREEQTTA